MNAYDIVTVDPVKGCVLFDFDTVPFGDLMNIVFIDTTNLHKAIYQAFFAAGFDEETCQHQADVGLLQIRDGLSRVIDSARGHQPISSTFVHNPSSLYAH